MSYIDRPSFLYVIDRNMGTPLYQLKVEIIEYRQTADNKVSPRTIVKSAYSVHDASDSVLRSASHTLFLMSKELGERSDLAQ